MKSIVYKIVSLLICCVMVLGISPVTAFADEGYTELDPMFTYTGAGITFEKISHANTGLAQPDGVVDYAGDGAIAVHDPNAETDLEGDRGQSYSYAAAAYGDWVYIGTMYGGLGASNILLNSMLSGFMQSGMSQAEAAQTASGIIAAMYDGRLYTGEPDGVNAGGIFFKFNIKTGETVVLLSKDLNGIIPTFRNVFEMDGKLYFVGMVQDVEKMDGQTAVSAQMTYLGRDMLDEAILMQAGFPVIYEVTPSEEIDGDVLNCIYDATEGDLDIYRSMVAENMFTSTRAIGSFKDTLIAGCMDENGPYLAASTDPSEGQSTFKRILDMDTALEGTDTKVGEYIAYHRNDGCGGGGIYQVVEFGGKLYMAVVSGRADTYNAETGTTRSFAILRGELKNPWGDVDDAENWTWSVLIGDKENDGAKYTFGISPDRYASNACTLQIYNGKLYIGEYNDTASGLQNILKSNFRTLNTNISQSLNLYRMDVHENIEMVVGDPCELFPEGSLTGIGSGYGAHTNQYHWFTTVRNGKLYLSTMDVSSFLEPLRKLNDSGLLDPEEPEDPENPEQQPPVDEHDLEALEEGTEPDYDLMMCQMLLRFINDDNRADFDIVLDYVLEAEMGFDLYVLEEHKNGDITVDTVTRNGFGDRNNHGLRVFVNTEEYLIAGTANPFYGTQIWRAYDPLLPEIDVDFGPKDEEDKEEVIIDGRGDRDEDEVNPNTGANSFVGGAAALAVLSGIALLFKRK